MTFPSHFSTYQPEPEASLIIPAFRLANMWNFADLRAYLIPLAERVLGDVDKIVFAQEFNVDKWIVPAYTRLCKREEPLNSDEATKIGLEGALLIFRIREEKYTSPASATCCDELQMPLRHYCDGCGGIKELGNLLDEDVEKKIDAWAKNGHIFTTSTST